ncbi:helix-turn-helix domain-containing protein [Streptomyces sp. NPDC096310]|uniref:helix-turn-helix domain-containing protein n=1 Tax=Streptomyces sp. NPDC096310 TaxID=3366082 RepID=UPI0038084AB5
MHGRPDVADASAHPGPPDRLDELLYLVGRQAWRPDVGVQGVVDWLHRQLGTEVALVGRAHTVELSTPGFPREILPALEPVLTRLATGRMAAAATEVGAVRVRLEGVGTDDPRRVLVLAGADRLTGTEAAAASHTGHIIALLHRARAADTALRDYQEKAHQMRVALFMALMAGDTVLARRMTTGAVPELLGADRIRVHLLRCAPAERDRIAQAHQDPSGYHGRAMMVRCPVYDEHLICLVAENKNENKNEDENEDGIDPPELAGVLRELVADREEYALGISTPHPLRATAEAYEEARHALAVAGNTAGRVARYQSREPLERLLPREEALAWARALLRPLRSLPELTAETTRLALFFPRSGVAALLGISRNTVTAHLARSEAALGLDLRDVRARAALTLALAVTTLHQDGEAAGAPAPWSGTEPPSGDGTAAAWAAEFLAPLHGVRHGSVLDTLRAWIESNADARRTALRLGSSRTTVAARLRTAERLLERDLLSTGSGVHELVYAFHFSGLSPGLTTGGRASDGPDDSP